MTAGRLKPAGPPPNINARFSYLSSTLSLLIIFIECPGQFYAKTE